MILIIFDVIKHAQTRLIWACIFIFVKLSVMNMAWRIKKFLHALWFISSSNHAVQYIHGKDYGRPMKSFFEAFFHSNLKLLGLGRQFGQIILSHFGYFQPIYQDPFWYCESMFFIHQQVIFTKNSAFISKSKILICKWDLNLSRDELGI